MDYNPYLTGRRRADQADSAASGAESVEHDAIERPDAQDNIPWQTRPAPPGEYELQLCDALEALFLAGVDDIAGLVDGLNKKGLKTAAGEAWTQAVFENEMKRLS